MYLHHPIFLWVQRVTPKRASVIGAPPGRTQAPLPPIGQISVLEKSRLALNLPHTRFVSYCRKHSADVHPHACRGHPPDPNAAFGRNFLAIVPKGQPKNGLPAALPKVYAPRGRFDNSVNPSSCPMDAPLFLLKRKNRVRRIHRTRFVRYCLRKSVCRLGLTKVSNPISRPPFPRLGQNVLRSPVSILMVSPPGVSAPRPGYPAPPAWSARPIPPERLPRRGRTRPAARKR